MSNHSADRPRLFIGTSGWNYKDWKEGFYSGVPQKKWLSHYAGRFNSVEVNATFYRQLQEKTYRNWLESTPGSFFFVIKGSRYVSHIKRLKEPEGSILKQRDNIAPLQPKLAGVLWQLPAKLEKDLGRLRDFLAVISREWGQTPHALELRNETWFDEEVAGLLEEHNVANCLSDAPSWPLWDRITSDVAYVRLHGHTELYRSAYTEEQLRAWADRARQWLEQGKTVHFYFDNTDSGAAPENAARLRELLR